MEKGPRLTPGPLLRFIKGCGSLGLQGPRTGQSRVAALQTQLIDTLDALGHCASDDDRWACGVRLLQDCGSDWITAGTAARGTGSALAIRSTTPDALMRDYMDQRLYLHDPWMQLCAASSDPDHF